jgi:hypothetical protein
MRLLLSLVLLFALPSAAAAQTAAAKKEPSAYDKLWGSFTEWYADDTNPVVQRVLLSGRFHYDFATINSDQGDLERSNIRRLRIGPRITLYRKYTLHAEVELDPQRRDPFYVRFTDFYLMWTQSPRIVVTVGRQSAPFTLDGATSSRELLTIDRSNLANNIWFPQEYLPGISLSGRRAPWVYRAALYSSGAANREFGEFSGGIVKLGVVGYDFAAKLGVREATTHSRGSSSTSARSTSASKTRNGGRAPICRRQRAISGRATCGRFRECPSSTLPASFRLLGATPSSRAMSRTESGWRHMKMSSCPEGAMSTRNCTLERITTSTGTA